MTHVNQHDGLTIAVSGEEFITRIAQRTVLSDSTMGVLVPVLEEVLRWDSREFGALLYRQWLDAS